MMHDQGMKLVAVYQQPPAREIRVFASRTHNDFMRISIRSYFGSGEAYSGRSRIDFPLKGDPRDLIRVLTEALQAAAELPITPSCQAVE